MYPIVRNQAAAASFIEMSKGGSRGCVVSDKMGRLAPGQRLEHYRQLATAARAKASTAASEELRDSYLKMAAGWQSLAEEMARQISKTSSTMPSKDESDGVPKQDVR